MVVGESTGGGGGWEGIFLGGGRMIEFSAGGGGRGEDSYSFVRL